MGFEGSEAGSTIQSSRWLRRGHCSSRAARVPGDCRCVASLDSLPLQLVLIFEDLLWDSAAQPAHGHGGHVGVQVDRSEVPKRDGEGREHGLVVVNQARHVDPPIIRMTIP
jgi:hypothetical protein